MRAGLWSGVVALLACMGAWLVMLRPHDGPEPSSDWAEVERGLVIDLRPQSARWEAFATPEADGWVPGPTDMETLVADLMLSADDLAGLGAAPRTHDETDADWVRVAANSARPWLAPAHQALLTRLAGADRQAAWRLANCRGIAVRGLKSKHDKPAFICIDGDRALLHVVLSGP